MQVQALRTVEKHLGLEKLYVLGTNCVDNGPRQGLDKFLRAASQDPDTVLHYEFMQVSIVCRPVYVEEFGNITVGHVQSVLAWAKLQAVLDR